MVIFLGIISAIVVVANIIVRAQGASWLALILKTLCGVLFMALGIYGVLTPSLNPEVFPVVSFGVLMLIGMAFGWIGDVVLALKDMRQNVYDMMLAAGILLFGIGHVFYIVALVRTYQTPLPWIPIVISLVFGVGVVLICAKCHFKFGVFKWPAVIYAALVTMLPATTFFTLATGTFPLDAAGQTILQPTVVVAISGVWFLISDMILAWAYFGPKPNRGWQHALCYIFYYAAQFGIATSLVLL